MIKFILTTALFFIRINVKKKTEHLVRSFYLSHIQPRTSWQEIKDIYTSTKTELIQQKFHTDIFIQIFPMNSFTIAYQTPVI